MQIEPAFFVVLNLCQETGRWILKRVVLRNSQGFRGWMTQLETAEWQSGYAAACKAVDLGSIPGSASIFCFTRSGPGWRNR